MTLPTSLLRQTQHSAAGCVHRTFLEKEESWYTPKVKKRDGIWRGFCRAIPGKARWALRGEMKTFLRRTARVLCNASKPLNADISSNTKFAWNNDRPHCCVTKVPFQNNQHRKRIGDDGTWRKKKNKPTNVVFQVRITLTFSFVPSCGSDELRRINEGRTERKERSRGVKGRI